MWLPMNMALSTHSPKPANWHGLDGCQKCHRGPIWSLVYNPSFLAILQDLSSSEYGIFHEASLWLATVWAPGLWQTSPKGKPWCSHESNLADSTCLYWWEDFGKDDTWTNCTFPYHFAIFSLATEIILLWCNSPNSAGWYPSSIRWLAGSSWI